MSELSKDELALYDRQIRLWGLEAQKKYLTIFLKELGFNCELFKTTGRLNSVNMHGHEHNCSGNLQKSRTFWDLFFKTVYKNGRIRRTTHLRTFNQFLIIFYIGF